MEEKDYDDERKRLVELLALALSNGAIETASFRVSMCVALELRRIGDCLIDLRDQNVAGTSTDETNRKRDEL